MGHASAQLRRHAAAFLLAHVVEPLDALFQSGGHLLLQRTECVAIFRRVQRARQLEHGVEVGLGADAKLFRDLAKGAQVSSHQFAVDGKGRAAAALHGQSDFYVAAVQALLEHAANFHLDGIQFDRQAQVQVEEAMVHRLQAQSQGELVVRVHLYLGVAGHGADVHGAITQWWCSLRCGCAPFAHRRESAPNQTAPHYSLSDKSFCIRARL